MVAAGPPAVTIDDMPAAMTYANAWIDTSDGWRINQLIEYLVPSDTAKHATVTRADRERAINEAVVRVRDVNNAAV